MKSVFTLFIFLLCSYGLSAQEIAKEEIDLNNVTDEIWYNKIKQRPDSYTIVKVDKSKDFVIKEEHLIKIEKNRDLNYEKIIWLTDNIKVVILPESKL